jgi:hypothetical protein
MSKHIDISEALQKKIRNRVYRIGIELEGFWKDKLPAGVARLDHDGSVLFPEWHCRSQLGDCYDHVSGKLVGYKGELPSPPLLPEGDDAVSLTKWLANHYPTKINATCGLHAHMSFSNAFVYMVLMKEEFMWTVIEFMKKWAHSRPELDRKDHPIWERLAGKSEYCQHVFMADGQAQKTRKEFDHHGKDHRYTVLNFAFARYGTIECRLLPMFEDSKLALAAIQELMRITNAFLFHEAKESQLTIDGKVAGKGEKDSSASWIADVGDSAHIERIEVSA